MVVPSNQNPKKTQYEKKKFRPVKTVKLGFWGLVGGGIIGILGFALSFYFYLSPFILAVLGVIVGLILDKKEEIEKNKKIFRNKP